MQWLCHEIEIKVVNGLESFKRAKGLTIPI